MAKKNQLFGSHFERIKEQIPVNYSLPGVGVEANENNELFKLLKKTLSIIEAIYLQDNNSLRPATLDEYSRILNTLHHLGFEYKGNEELMKKAAAFSILQNKKPMQKAGIQSNKDNNRKAI